jgi:hypothetical protein
VFDETKAVSWDISLPPKMEDAKVCASVRNALTGEAAMTAEGKDMRSFNIWDKAGGKGCTAVVTTFENVKPVDGAIKIEFFSAVVNGIEIEKVK